jgi:3-methyladenine DNA glycosylase AlkD
MTANQVSTYVNAVEAALTPLRDDTRAAVMAAYMKHHAPFLGIPTPLRREAVKAIPKPELSLVHAIARALWQRSEREYHYVAIDLLKRSANRLDPVSSLLLVEALALNNSWWDSVDGLASVASTVLRQHPNARGIVRAWAVHESFWVNRLAILHQNGWGPLTDQALLFELCLAHAHTQEFFIRKAIGWALRDYARHKPNEVRNFVQANRHSLSALSVREALKHIGD